MTTVEYDKIEPRHWATVEITTLPRATLEQIMENQLKSRGKVRCLPLPCTPLPYPYPVCDPCHVQRLRGQELSEKQRDRILSSPACGNALFLIVLVTELCQVRRCGL